MADHSCPTSQTPSHVTTHPTPVDTGRNATVSGLANPPAPDTPYYTPLQAIPAGTAILHKDASSTSLPLLFQPLKLRGLTLQNRVAVSPMCEYSAEDGHFTDWHLVHLGGIISRGPGLTVIEATSVTEEGRITPQDAGLWTDSQIAPLKRIVDFAHSQGQHVAIQLGHAGRKASTVAPWIDRKAAAPADAGGWPDKVISATEQAYDQHSIVPRKMNLQDIQNFKDSFVAAVKRALRAGIDVIEIHAAHGYLVHSTLVEETNHLPAPYSGSQQNRFRLLMELTALTRAAIPTEMPLMIRLPATDWVEYNPEIKGFDINQCVALAKVLSAPGVGVDLLDISTGGLLAAQKITSGPSYQAKFSKAVKKAVEGTGVLVGAVGMIRTGSQAEGLLQDGSADVIFAGRGFQKDTALVWKWAEDLDVEVRLANQIGWGWGQRAAGGMKGEQPVRT